jgi:hypothetical protein
LCWHNDIKWFYNEKLWTYQKSKNNFIIKWISDISILFDWKFIAIEVKRPEELKFFEKSIEELEELYNQSIETNKSKSLVKKYLHAIEQNRFLIDINQNWWIWFFTSSLDETIEKLKKFNIIF